ncbi:unnamed protein product, partial [marine sediment metagenome]
MRIPLIYAEQPMQVTLATAGKGWQARGAAADQAQTLVEGISRHQAILREKERLAQDALAAVEIDNTMRQKYADLD